MSTAVVVRGARAICSCSDSKTGLLQAQRIWEYIGFSQGGNLNTQSPFYQGVIQEKELEPLITLQEPRINKLCLLPVCSRLLFRTYTAQVA